MFHHFFHGNVGVYPRAFEEVNTLLSGQESKAIVDGGADASFASVRKIGLQIEAAFDAEDDFQGVFGVFGKVGIQNVAGVILW